LQDAEGPLGVNRTEKGGRGEGGGVPGFAIIYGNKKDFKWLDSKWVGSLSWGGGEQGKKGGGMGFGKGKKRLKGRRGEGVMRKSRQTRKKKKEEHAFEG